MDNKKAGKKTQGRRKIEMKKIENKTRLQVTFSKRRPGLFIKASELVVLCGVEIAILVQSPAGKIYAFGHPSVEAVINRLQMLPPQMAATNSRRQIVLPDDSRSKYEEAERKLEIENRRMKGKGREFWWDECCEGLELHELEEYLEALQVLRNNVSRKVVEIEKLMELKGDLSLVSSNQQLVSDPTSASSNFLALTNHDQAVVDYDVFDLASK